MSGVCTHAQSKDGFCPGPFLYGCQTEGPVCHERDEEDQKMSDHPGPWFTAGYDDECSRGGHEITDGDEIRADGEGGWECRECVQDDLDRLDDETPPKPRTANDLFGF